MESKYPAARLGDFVRKIGSGATPRGGNDVYLTSGTTALIRSQNVYNNFLSKQGLAYLDDEAAQKLSNVAVEKDDVLLNITGDSVARCCSAPDFILPARVNQHVAIIRPDPNEFDPNFVRYFLVADEMQTHMLNLASAGATRNALTKAMIQNFKVPKPAIGIQRRISEILGNFDAKIEVLRQMNETLSELTSAMYQAWFVNFEPVRAKALGEKTFLGIPDTVFNTLSDHLQEADGQSKPSDWKVQSLRVLVSELRRGISPSYIENGGVCVLNQKCIRNRTVNSSLGRRHDSTQRPVNGRLVDLLDILVNSTGVGTLGRAAQVYELEEATVVDSHVTVVRPDETKIDPLYLGFNLTLRESEIEALGQGSTGQTELGREKLGGLPVLVPPTSLQRLFANTAKPLVDRSVSNAAEIEMLANIRDTLLPKLLSGEIDVLDAGEFIGG